MAPARRKNVSKNHTNVKASRSKDKAMTDKVKVAVEEEDNKLSSSDGEISDVDSDIEELAAKSASAILSRLDTRVTMARKQHTQKSTRTRSKREIRSGGELSVASEQQSDDGGEVQFFIDVKPFSRESSDETSNIMSGSTSMNAHDSAESESDDADGDDSHDSSSESTSHAESDDDSEQDQRLDRLKHHPKAKRSSLTLRDQISKEISKITQGKGDRLELASEMDPGIECGSYVSYDLSSTSTSKQQDSLEEILQKSRNDKLIQKSVITLDFEKKHDLPKVSYNQRKKLMKKFRTSKSGSGWYDMPAQEMTEELRNDLRILRMRSALDPKRFYKHSDMNTLPKFVQIGTVVDSPADFYQSRVPNRQRKQNVVDELLADADMRSCWMDMEPAHDLQGGTESSVVCCILHRYNKRKYLELQERSRRRVEGKFPGKQHKKFKKVKDV